MNEIKERVNETSDDEFIKVLIDLWKTPTNA
jgi:hypothetical protein